MNPEGTLAPVWVPPEMLRPPVLTYSSHTVFNLNEQSAPWFFFPLFCFAGVLLNTTALEWGSSGNGRLGRREKSLQGTRKLLFRMNEALHSVVEEGNAVTCVVLLCGTSASLN